MQSALKRIDNELSIALPAEAAEAAGLFEGAKVDVVIEGASLVIKRHKITLAEMLAEMEGKEPPPLEWDDWEPRGSEVW